MVREGGEFSPEYKNDAVRLVINTGRQVATVARELGISEAALPGLATKGGIRRLMRPLRSTSRGSTDSNSVS